MEHGKAASSFQSDCPQLHPASVTADGLLRRLSDRDWRAPYLLAWSKDTPYGKSSISRRLAFAAITDARKNHTSTVYSPVGPANFCFQHVAQCVEDGRPGRAIYGWRVSPSFSFEVGVELETHAVWQEPDGTLTELCEGHSDHLFAPSQSVSANLAVAVLSGHSTPKMHEMYGLMLRAMRVDREMVSGVEMIRNPLSERQNDSLTR